MSKKSCPKSDLPGKPTSNVFLQEIGQTLSTILSPNGA